MIHRRPLPNRRTHISQKVQIAGEPTLYLSVHDDRQSPEVFLRVKGQDCFAELISLNEVIARLMSLALQHGAPLEKVVDLLAGAKSAPCGWHLGSSVLKAADLNSPDPGGQNDERAQTDR